jgi:uncharacterized protein YxjI
MVSSIRCPKCGLAQMAGSACRSCGTAFATQPAPRAARPAVPVVPSVRPGAPVPRTFSTDPAVATSGAAALGSRGARAGAAPLDPAFDRTRFLLRQKALTVHEKYDVWDENGQPILYVERPAHFWRNGGALLAGVAAGLAAATLIVLGFGALSSSNPPTWVPVLTFTLAGIALIVLPFLVFARLGRTRDILFARDASKAEPLLVVRQDQVTTLLEHTFTVAEPAGRVLAHFKKNPLTALYRTKWVCNGPDGRCLAVAIEDSLVGALIRRYVIRVTPMNFVFRRGETEQVIGRFDRKFTLLDRYVLDVSADPAGTLDRRIALALGVILDTGERR